jgi:hypothetical protein
VRRETGGVCSILIGPLLRDAVAQHATKTRQAGSR